MDCSPRRYRGQPGLVSGRSRCRDSGLLTYLALKRFSTFAMIRDSISELLAKISCSRPSSFQASFHRSALRRGGWVAARLPRIDQARWAGAGGPWRHGFDPGQKRVLDHWKEPKHIEGKISSYGATTDALPSLNTINGVAQLQMFK